MTFWGGQRLLTDGKAQAIVDPFDESMIDCSAYTLTLGQEAYVTPHYGDNPRDSVKQPLAPTKHIWIGGSLQKSGGGVVVIPPGQFAFLLTEEVVSIPRDAMGFISLKSKPKFGGLINVSGFHVDPGFTGKLIYSVFNAGPNPLHFSRGDRLFLLWIADVSGEVQSPFYKTGAGYAEIPSDLVTKVAAENHSLQSLSRRVEALSSQVVILSGIAAGLAVVFGLLIAWFGLNHEPNKAVNDGVQIVRPAVNAGTVVQPPANRLVPPINPTGASNPPDPSHS